MQSSAGSSPARVASSCAPVLEFLCLFTQDLRRKQKRWQDGRLKFHTFNKRIMVYDDRGKFVGDAHWHEDFEFGDGEEVELERGNTIVQAGECVGSRDQDLSELVDKRIQEKAQRQEEVIARQSRAAPSPLVPVAPRASLPQIQPRHRPLHHSIGTPSGHHGRALILNESPIEEPQQLQAQQESPRPAKRRKREPSPPSKSGYAQSLFGATLTLSATLMSSAPVRHRSRKTLQNHQSQFTSSGPRNQINDDDDVREVTPPAESRPQMRSKPLSDQSTSNNISRTSNNLVANQMRSEIGQPTISQQCNSANDLNNAGTTTTTRPAPVTKRADGPRQRITANHITVPGHDAGESCEPIDGPLRPMTNSYQPPRQRDGRRQSDGLGEAHKKIQTDALRRYLTRKREKKKQESRADQAKKPTKQPDAVDLASSDACTAEEESLATNQVAVDVRRKPPNGNSTRKAIDHSNSTAIDKRTLSSGPVLAESEKPLREAAVEAERRTELRVKPRKKRGLLMMSGSDSAKKAWKSSDTGINRISRTSDTSFPTVISEDGDLAVDSGAFPLAADSHARRKTTAGQHQTHERPVHDHHSPADDDTTNDQIDDDFPEIDSNLFSDEDAENLTKSNGPGGQKSAPKRNSANSRMSKKNCNNDTKQGAITPATVSRIPETNLTTGSIGQDIDSSADPFEEMVQRRAEISRLRRGSSFRKVTTETTCAEQSPLEMETDGLEMEVSTRTRGSLRRTESRGDTERAVAPHPRLAQIKKTVRSKEVIGFISDDDDDEPIIQSHLAYHHEEPRSLADPLQNPSNTEQLTEPSSRRERPQPQSHQREKHVVRRERVEPSQGKATNIENKVSPENEPEAIRHTAVTREKPKTRPVEDQQQLTAVEKPTAQEIDDWQPQRMSIESEKPAPDLQKDEQPQITTENPTTLETGQQTTAVQQPLKLLDDQGEPVANPKVVEPKSEANLAAQASLQNDPNTLPWSSVSRTDNHRALSGPAVHGNTGVIESNFRIPRSEHTRSTRAKSHPQGNVTANRSKVQTDKMLGQKQDVELDFREKGMEETRSKPQAAPRLVNPATRGRKAAKPSDKVGRVPESVLSSEAALSVLPRKASRAAATDADKQPKETLTHPGFTKANGGPWSREAHDLFEFKRPM